ncbi:Alpha/Beta hydrolase protein [Irpex lacteus]|nr:Alpha/Beta hydrolase protein [Irpex lacteus]
MIILKTLAFASIATSALAQLQPLSNTYDVQARLRATSGYLDVDVGAKHLFFYFFESRRDPAKDDVMMWINGGKVNNEICDVPAEDFLCRPCIDMKNSSSNGTLWNPTPGIMKQTYSSSINRGLHITTRLFYLYRPEWRWLLVCRLRGDRETTEEAARNVHAFITIFFHTFSQFAGRPLHLSGSRSLSARVCQLHYDQNQMAKAAGRSTINLTSVLIGNGITDISTCDAAMRQGCVDHFDSIDCRAAVAFVTRSSAQATGLADAMFMTFPRSVPTLLYRRLDIDGDPDCSVSRSRYRILSAPGQVRSAFAVLRRRPARARHPILIYAGTYDWQCNWVANKLWVEKLEWTGSKGYAKQAWRDWTVGGEKAGETKSWGALTFATIRGAGHMVPHDKPVESFAMVSRWLARRDL